VESHTGSLPAEHSYISVAPENVVLTAVKKAEDDNGLIFRVFEWAGKQSDVVFTLPKGATAATETDLMEKPTGSPLNLSGDKVTIPIHPYEILSIRADYPHEKMDAMNQ
jgi:alpha-mannosidase